MGPVLNYMGKMASNNTKTEAIKIKTHTTLTSKTCSSDGLDENRVEKRSSKRNIVLSCILDAAVSVFFSTRCRRVLNTDGHWSSMKYSSLAEFDTCPWNVTSAQVLYATCSVSVH